MNQQNETTANNEAITVLTQLHGSQKFKDVAAAKQEIARIKEEFNVELPPVYDEYLAAVSAFREDRLPESSDLFESCLSFLDDKQHVLSAYCCVYLGTIYSIGREYHHALQYFAQAENTRREHDHKLALFLHVNRSAIYIMLDDYEKALTISKKAVEHGKHLEAPATYGLALCNLAVAQAKLSLLDEALVNIEEAVEYSGTHNFGRAFGYAQCYHAYITGLTGDLKKASILYKKAFEEIKKLDDAFLRIEFYQYYSAFLFQCGHYSFAIKFCSGALSSSVLDSNTKAQAAIYTVLADCHRELGQLDEEVKYLRTLNTLNRRELKRSEQNEVHYIDSFLNWSRAESREAYSSTFTDNLTLLNQLGQRIITFDDDQQSMLLIYEQVQQLVPCSALSLAFYNKESHSLQYKYLIDDGEIVKSFEVSCAEVSRIGIHCANNLSTVVLDTSTENEVNSYLDEQYKSANSCWVNDENGVMGTSVITTPVIFEGNLIAVLSIQKDKSHSYNDYHLQVVKQIANYFAMSLTHLKQKQELEDNRIFMEQIYKTDHLTGLKNRFGVKPYLEKVQQSSAENASISALVLDVDYLKAFNNHYGMATGDNLLVTFSDILNHVCNQKGEVFRVGGDEFVVILPSVDSNQALEVAKQIKIHLKNSEIQNAGAVTENLVTCTIGIIELNELSDLSKFEQDLFQGERALIRAKKEKRNRLLRYSVA